MKSHASSFSLRHIALAGVAFASITALALAIPSKQPDPLLSLFTPASAIESSVQADLITSDLKKYSGTIPSDLKTCMNATQFAGVAGKVQGTFNFAADLSAFAAISSTPQSDILKWKNEKSDVILLSASAIRNAENPVFGTALSGNSINWRYDGSNYTYTFITPSGDETLWYCYFKQTSPFFSKILKDVSFVNVTDTANTSAAASSAANTNAVASAATAEQDITYTQNSSARTLTLSWPDAYPTARITHTWQSNYSLPLAAEWRRDASTTCKAATSTDTAWQALVQISGNSGTFVNTVQNPSDHAGCTYEFKLFHPARPEREPLYFRQIWAQEPTLSYSQNGQTATITYPSFGKIDITHKWIANTAHAPELTYQLKSGMCRALAGDDSLLPKKLDFVNSKQGSHTVTVDAADFAGCTFSFGYREPGGNIASFFTQTFQQDSSFSYTQNGATAAIYITGNTPITHAWRVNDGDTAVLEYRKIAGGCITDDAPPNYAWLPISSVSGSTGSFTSATTTDDYNRYAGCAYEFRFYPRSTPDRSIHFLQRWGTTEWKNDPTALYSQNQQFDRLVITPETKSITHTWNIADGGSAILEFRRKAGNCSADSNLVASAWQRIGSVSGSTGSFTTTVDASYFAQYKGCQYEFHLSSDKASHRGSYFEQTWGEIGQPTPGSLAVTTDFSQIAATLSSGAQNAEVYRANLSASKEGASITRLTFKSLGTAPDGALTRIALEYPTADGTLSAVPGIVQGGAITYDLTAKPFVINAGATGRIRLLVDVSSTFASALDMSLKYAISPEMSAVGSVTKQSLAVTAPSNSEGPTITLFR